ncbi:MAG: Gfo/Idh/MocA family oxidoreductase [Phycisphaerae bacterium]|nr:Gfo/Idh/MocA family oxidoreductase [Phycisphaerae bacterium]
MGIKEIENTTHPVELESPSAPEQRQLTVAVIGLTELTETLLDIAWAEPGLRIVAAGDTDPVKAEAAARKYECTTYTDYRQLIVRNEADVLLVGAAPHQAFEYIRQALQKKMNILSGWPWAVNFEQGAEFVNLARREGVLFTVAQNGRFGRPFEYIKEFLHASVEQSNTIHLISAVCHIPVGPLEPSQRWLYDPKLAGGGVLVQNCYNLIDELSLCFGLPQRVYALTQSQAPDRQQRLSLTEDTAVMTMQYSDTLMAQVCASRTLGPARQHLRIHGKDRHLTATPEEVVVCDNTGAELERAAYKDDRRPALERLLKNLAGHLLDPKEHPLYPDHGVDLNTLAVIEAAYLSARTGMPEEPARILRLAGAAELNIDY